MTLHVSHRAMGTQFEVWLCGEDTSHLQSVAFLVWEEVDRLEMMLSRHDPRAEIARVNREAAQRPTRVEVELFDILRDCLAWTRQTNGYFDISFASEHPKPVKSPPYVLDVEQRTIRFARNNVCLDLGGYGKGYALERIAQLLRKYGITSACIHGGSSSVLAMGTQENGQPWQVDIPHHKDRSQVVHRQPLLNQGFSYSGTTSEQMSVSDIVDPHQRIPITGSSACWVQSASALDAEVWSTALLAMGRAEADRLITQTPKGLTTIGWI